MLTTWHHHHRHTHHDELQELYWSRFSLALAGGLVSIFVPIYLLQQGVSFQSLLAFYLLLAACNVLLAPLSMQVLLYLGSNRSMALGSLFQIICYLLLATFGGQQSQLVLIAVMAAVANELYWPAFHANFSTAEDKKLAGKQVGFLTVVTGVAQALTPLIGGLIALAFGIKSLYIPAACIVLIGAVPLLLNSNVVTEKTYTLKRLRWHEVRPDMVAIYGSSIAGLVEQIFWPLIIFLLLNNVALMGGLTTITLVVSAAVAVWVGRSITKNGTRRYVNTSSIMVSIMNVFRLLATSVVAISGLNLFAGVVASLYGTAYTTAFYRNASRSERLSYLLASELVWHIGWVSVLGILYILSYSLAPRTVLLVGLVIASFASLLIRKIRHLETV